jgi:hypothetical protein
MLEKERATGGLFRHLRQERSREDGENKMALPREIEQWHERFEFEIEDTKRYFGQWDAYDPISWAILRVVQAQNDLAHAFDQVAIYGVNDRMLEEAFKERLEAITALQKAIKKYPRGPLSRATF